MYKWHWSITVAHWGHHWGQLCIVFFLLGHGITDLDFRQGFLGRYEKCIGWKTESGIGVIVILYVLVILPSLLIVQMMATSEKNWPQNWQFMDIYGTSNHFLPYFLRVFFPVFILSKVMYLLFISLFILFCICLPYFILYYPGISRFFFPIFFIIFSSLITILYFLLFPFFLPSLSFLFSSTFSVLSSLDVYVRQDAGSPAKEL